MLANCDLRDGEVYFGRSLFTSLVGLYWCVVDYVTNRCYGVMTVMGCFIDIEEGVASLRK